jgi:excisionase family DNA binding protein
MTDELAEGLLVKARGERDPLATASELAELLHVHRSSISRWSSSGRIPCVRIPGGSTVRYDVEAVMAALEEQGMDAVAERNQRIREDAMKRAEQTYVVDCVDRQGNPTCVIVIAHPGQELNLDPTYLKENFGVRPDQVIKLSESREAPRPYDPEADLQRKRKELQELEAQVRARAANDDGMIDAAAAAIDAAAAEIDGNTASRKRPPAPRTQE